jgi:cytoskeleton protein RodZ
VDKSFEETGVRTEGFGQRLRQQREMRGISLDEIAATTKIGTRFLRALEDEQFELLPGGIFNKGYVRAYARHLGIDEDQAVADYLRAARENPPDVRLIARQNSAMPGRYSADPTSARRGFPLLPILILLIVIVGAAGGWKLYRQRQRERAQPVQPPAMTQTTGVNGSTNSALSGPASATPPVENTGVSPPAASTAGPSVLHTVEAAESSSHTGSTAASERSAVNRDAGAQPTAPFAVTVRARDRARIEVRSDGEVVVRGVIEPSEVRTFHATNRLVLWTANADVVEISFNGKSVPVSGGQKGEQALVFNSHGLLPRSAMQ